MSYSTQIKKIALGTLVSGTMMLAPVAFAQTAATSSADYSKGTYYYYYNGQTGANTVSADPATAGSANVTPKSAVDVQNANAGSPTAGTYYYYYTTQGAGTPNVTPAQAVGETVSQTGSAPATTQTAPGLPNTGGGGEAVNTFFALASGLVLMLGGALVGMKSFRFQ